MGKSFGMFKIIAAKDTAIIPLRVFCFILAPFCSVDENSKCEKKYGKTVDLVKNGQGMIIHDRTFIKRQVRHKVTKSFKML
jgi:hypothetical protein